MTNSEVQTWTQMPLAIDDLKNDPFWQDILYVDGVLDETLLAKELMDFAKVWNTLGEVIVRCGSGVISPCYKQYTPAVICNDIQEAVDQRVEESVLLELEEEEEKSLDARIALQQEAVRFQKALQEIVKICDSSDLSRDESKVDLCLDQAMVALRHVTQKNTKESTSKKVSGNQYVVGLVVTDVTGYQSFIVEADSEEEAKRKVQNGEGEYMDSELHVNGLDGVDFVEKYIGDE